MTSLQCGKLRSMQLAYVVDAAQWCFSLHEALITTGCVRCVQGERFLSRSNVHMSITVMLFAGALNKHRFHTTVSAAGQWASEVKAWMRELLPEYLQDDPATVIKFGVLPAFCFMCSMYKLMVHKF